MTTAEVEAGKTRTGAQRARRGIVRGAFGAALCLVLVPATPRAQSLTPVQAPLRFAQPTALYRWDAASTLQSSVLQSAARLYGRAAGVSTLSVNDSALVASFQSAITGLTQPFSANYSTEPALHYLLFGDLGGFTHLVEQTVVQTAARKHVTLQDKPLSKALKAEFGTPASPSQKIFTTVAAYRDRVLRQSETDTKNPPVDPNLMMGPTRLQADKEVTDRHSLLSPRETRVLCRLPLPTDQYPQPLIYTIKFENLPGASVGDATTVMVAHTLDAGKLDINRICPLQITFTDQATPRAIVPSFAYCPVGTSVFTMGSMRVTLKRTGSQLTWTFIDGTLAPGGKGSVSIQVFPKNTGVPTNINTIRNVPAKIRFIGPGGQDSKSTNAWPM